MDKKIGVFKLSALGDIIWIIPLLKFLAKKMPQYEITFITDPLFIPLLKTLNPSVSYLPLKKPRSLKGYFQAIKLLKKYSFDIFILAQASFRTNILSPFIKSKLKIGLEKKRGKDFQSLFVDKVPSELNQQNTKHQIFSLLNTISIIDPSFSLAISQIKLSPSDFGFTNSETKTNKIILHPVASSKDRTPIISFWMDLILKLQNKYPNFEILITGSKDDFSFCEEISKNTNAKNIAGTTDLISLSKLFCQSSLVIAPDTGPIHLASVAGTSVIGLYVAVPHEFTGPIFHPHLVIDKYNEFYEKKFGKTPSPKIWPPKRLYGNELREAFNADEVLEKILSHSIL